MSDATSGVIGGILMTAFLLLIAAKLNQIALWTVILIGLAMMFWAIWTDTLAPLLRRNGNGVRT